MTIKNQYFLPNWVAHVRSLSSHSPRYLAVLFWDMSVRIIGSKGQLPGQGLNASNRKIFFNIVTFFVLLMFSLECIFEQGIFKNFPERPHQLLCVTFIIEGLFLPSRCLSICSPVCRIRVSPFRSCTYFYVKTLKKQFCWKIFLNVVYCRYF